MYKRQSYKEPIKTSDKAILVVDDSNIIRNFILKILDDSFDVISATDGKEAIDILEKYDKGDCYLTNLTRFLIHRTH